MPRITLFIPGEPIAQPRCRAVSIAGKGRLYTPMKSGIAVYKATIRMAAAEAYRGSLLDCPVVVNCEFVFNRPGRLVWKTRPMPRAPHTAKRDRDNLDKACLDALVGVVLKDDKIVYGGEIWKWYAAGDEQPHTKIVIQWGSDDC